MTGEFRPSCKTARAGDHRQLKSAPTFLAWTISGIGRRGKCHVVYVKNECPQEVMWLWMWETSAQKESCCRCEKSPEKNTWRPLPSVQTPTRRPWFWLASIQDRASLKMLYLFMWNSSRCDSGSSAETLSDHAWSGPTRPDSVDDHL